MTEADAIQAAGAGDRDAVIALWQEAGLVRPWNDPATDFALALACPTSCIFVARNGGGRIVASVMAGWDGHRGWLYYLAVWKDHRGRGLGRRMVAAAEAWLRGQGAPKVQLMVRGDNDAAQGFYDRLGYGYDDVVIRGRRFER